MNVKNWLEQKCIYNLMFVVELLFILKMLNQ